MRIALIDPAGINQGLNVGLGILAGCLLRNGHQVSVIDLNNDRRDYSRRLADIRSHEMIGVSFKSFTVNQAGMISGALGRRDLVCGGAHISIDGENFLRENPCFSIGVVGEAEESMVELADSWQRSASFDRIAGLIVRGNAAITATGRREFIQDLDQLPFPAYEVFDSVKQSIDDYPLITSRGCPYSCSYCCVGRISGKKMRLRSVTNVLDELAHARDRFASKRFSILDDNFTFDMQRAKDFCRLLIERGYGMEWCCPNGLRADRLDEELIRLMHESGCRQVSIGVESLDEAVFAGINKGEQHEDIRRAVELFKKYRIKVNGFFLIGLPQDTEERSRRSLSRCGALGLDSAHWNMFVPYPGTAAWEWVNGHGRILRDWKQGFHFGPQLKATFETPAFSQQQMVRAYVRANITCRNYSAFYDAQAPFVANMLRIAWIILRFDALHSFGHLGYLMRNFNGLKNYLRA